MSITISAVDARRTLGELLNRVMIANEEIIIERSGKKIAKLVNCEQSVAKSSNEGKLDFRSSAGLGKKQWREIDIDKYIQKERCAWD